MSHEGLRYQRSDKMITSVEIPHVMRSTGLPLLQQRASNVIFRQLLDFCYPVPDKLLPAFNEGQSWNWAIRMALPQPGTEFVPSKRIKLRSHQMRKKPKTWQRHGLHMCYAPLADEELCGVSIQHKCLVTEVGCCTISLWTCVSKDR